MKIKSILFILIHLVYGAANAQYSCQATAEPYGEDIDAVGNYKIGFVVTPVNCPGKCRGYVNFDIVYAKKTDRVGKIRGQILWKSESNSDVDVTRSGSVPICNVFGLGPCEVRDVKMYNVTCGVVDE